MSTRRDFVKKTTIIGTDIAFKEHVPNLTSKEDISVLKTYIKEHYKA